jgi:hypothetical protein
MNIYYCVSHAHVTNKHVELLIAARQNYIFVRTSFRATQKAAYKQTEKEREREMVKNHLFQYCRPHNAYLYVPERYTWIAHWTWGT